MLNIQTFSLGLDVYINITETLYTTLKVDGEKVNMSRADFWALAGLESVRYSSELAAPRCQGPNCPEGLPVTKYVNSLPWKN